MAHAAAKDIAEVKDVVDKLERSVMDLRSQLARFEQLFPQIVQQLLNASEAVASERQLAQEVFKGVKETQKNLADNLAKMQADCEAKAEQKRAAERETADQEHITAMARLEERHAAATAFLQQQHTAAMAEVEEKRAQAEERHNAALAELMTGRVLERADEEQIIAGSPPDTRDEHSARATPASMVLRKELTEAINANMVSDTAKHLETLTHQALKDLLKGVTVNKLAALSKLDTAALARLDLEALVKLDLAAFAKLNLSALAQLDLKQMKGLPMRVNGLKGAIEYTPSSDQVIEIAKQVIEEAMAPRTPSA